MKKTDLITVAKIFSNVLAKLNKREYVAIKSIHKVYRALRCDVGNICVMIGTDKSLK